MEPPPEFLLDIAGCLSHTDRENGVWSVRLEGFFDCSGLLRAGVYALCLKGKVVYIGKSKRLYVRIYAHRNAWRKRVSSFLRERYGVKSILFDEVHIQPCSIEELDKLEQKLIAKYLPQYNVKHIPSAKITIPIKINTKGFSFTINAPANPIGKYERRL